MPPCLTGVRRRHFYLLVYEAQLLPRSRDDAPKLFQRLELLLIDRTVGVYCHAWPWFVEHRIDAGCVVVSSCIVPSDEDVPSISQLPQRRGMAAVGSLVHQERDSAGSFLQYSYSPNPRS